VEDDEDVFGCGDLFRRKKDTDRRTDRKLSELSERGRVGHRAGSVEAVPRRLGSLQTHRIIKKNADVVIFYVRSSKMPVIRKRI